MVNMDVSPNALRKSNAEVLRQIEKAEINIRAFASAHGVPSESVRDNNGNWVIVPLLLAKAQCLNTLALLQEKKK